ALPIDVAAAVECMQSTHHILIGIGDGPGTRGQAPSVLVERLAGVVVQILRERPVTRLLSEGGATTAAVMRAMRWTRLEATKIAAPGIGALRPVGTTGPQLFIKPGSYAWPKEIWPPSA
ncbi:MAG TPA: nucleotide-binding domain containing protein, partial [Opitutus sp.]|nr:nucleotide-binding domain containing protein [Opitutus sp.]